jgi:cytosine/adenosine deaminase-related metal-dependent hydrolase
MRDPDLVSEEGQEKQIVIRAICYADCQHEGSHVSIEIAAGRIAHILKDRSSALEQRDRTEIDLRGFLVMPGFINAHDHLDFSLFPRLADPPYRNYIEWGEDIHKKFPHVIARHRAVPKEVRVWWGGIRNLLCGVTSVSHHNPLHPEMLREEFPVRVIQKYGWAHSLSLGGDIKTAHAATPKGCAFIIHACEGIDEQARDELRIIDELGLLDADTVLVHGLAIDHEGIALMRARGASLIVCPSSNSTLFQKLPDGSLLNAMHNVALGNDSPLTAEGDLLDEVQFALRHCSLSLQTVFRMVTIAPAAMFRLKDNEGSITESGVADLIAVRDTGQTPAEKLRNLSIRDIEFVMVAGRVQLVSEAILARLPLHIKRGLEPLCIDGTIRWLRAPVCALLQKAEEVLGRGKVRLGSRVISIPPCAESKYAF